MTNTFVTDGVETALEHAEAAAGDKNVVLLGANLARQCLEFDRLDEILVQVTPSCSVTASACSLARMANPSSWRSSLQANQAKSPTSDTG